MPHIFNVPGTCPFLPHRCAWLAGVLSATLIATGLPPSAAAALLPHVAHYRLSHHHSDADSRVRAVKGLMEVRFEISCDGYRIDQYLGFNVLSDDDSRLEHLAYLSSFEDADGKDFWFDARSYENRRLTEELGGRATIEASGEGEARYTRPQEVSQDLPAGTMFPVGYLRNVIDAARAGRKSVRLTVFDGSSKDNPYEISTFIGAVEEQSSEEIRALEGSVHWPMRLAYFRVDATGLAPEFEMSADVYENGVIGNMIYDYGSFAIGVTLEKVEALPRPEC